MTNIANFEGARKQRVSEILSRMDAGLFEVAKELVTLLDLSDVVQTELGDEFAFTCRIKEVGIDVTISVNRQRA